MIRKVLISPGFGAGWSTWAGDEYADDMLFDPKLIAAIERGADPMQAAEDFLERMRQKHGADTYIYLGGALDLRVVEVPGPFIVEEYDGSESLRLRDHSPWH